MKKRKKFFLSFLAFIFIFLIAGIFVLTMLRNRPVPPYVDMPTIEQIKSECDRLCSGIKEASSEYFLDFAWEYCVSSFAISEIEYKEINKTGKEFFCQDAVPCFNVVKCNAKNMEIDAEKCLELMCPKALEIFEGNITKANLWVRENINKGTCDLPENNWYNLYFKNPDCSKFLSLQAGESLKKSDYFKERPEVKFPPAKEDFLTPPKKPPEPPVPN